MRPHLVYAQRAQCEASDQMPRWGQWFRGPRVIYCANQAYDVVVLFERWNHIPRYVYMCEDHYKTFCATYEQTEGVYDPK